jgi:hypothetical protein
MTRIKPETDEKRVQRLLAILAESLARGRKRSVGECQLERRGEERKRRGKRVCCVRVTREGESERARESTIPVERARVLHFGLMYGVALRDGAHWLRANLADEVHRNG